MKPRIEPAGLLSKQLRSELDAESGRLARHIDKLRYADLEGPPEPGAGDISAWLPPHSGGPPILERGVGADLKRITAERQPDGMWKLVRERETDGETFQCDDLHDVMETVLAAYYPDGTPRPWPRSTVRQSEETKP